VKERISRIKKFLLDSGQTRTWRQKGTGKVSIEKKDRNEKKKKVQGDLLDRERAKAKYALDHREGAQKGE